MFLQQHLTALALNQIAFSQIQLSDSPFFHAAHHSPGAAEPPCLPVQRHSPVLLVFQLQPSVSVSIRYLHVVLVDLCFFAQKILFFLIEKGLNFFLLFKFPVVKKLMSCPDLLSLLYFQAEIFGVIMVPVSSLRDLQ